jgi:hypothetical protein
MNSKTTFILALLMFFGSAAFAQYEDDYGSDYGSDDPYADPYGDESDTTSNDPYADPYADDPYASDDPYADPYEEEEVKPKVVKKPYVRVTLPYDSIAELVTYVEITEVLEPDDYLGDPYSSADSLYQRAFSFLVKEFGEKQVKKWMEESGEDYKLREGKTILIVAEFPVIVEYNEFRKIEAGKIVFDMELRFKDERYRYKFNNFQHVMPPSNGSKKESVNYFEYYLTSTVNVKNNDRILIAADKKINEMIAGLKASCNEPLVLDDDDW